MSDLYPRERVIKSDSPGIVFDSSDHSLWAWPAFLSWWERGRRQWNKWDV